MSTIVWAETPVWDALVKERTERGEFVPNQIEHALTRRDLVILNVRQLRALGRKWGVKGYSTLNRTQLIDTLQHHELNRK